MGILCLVVDVNTDDSRRCCQILETQAHHSLCILLQPIFTTSCTDVKRPEDRDLKGSEGKCFLSGLELRK